MAEKPVLVWLRLDLRLEDNPAIIAAVKKTAPIIPVFIYSPEEEKPWAPGSAGLFWLHQSLKSFDGGLKKLGSRLILKKGKSFEVLKSLVKETGAGCVLWNRRYEPSLMKRDAEIKNFFKKEGLECESFNSALLFEPWQILTKQKTPYQVYTAFWNTCLTLPEPAQPVPAPAKMILPEEWPKSEKLEAFGFEPKIKWAEGIRGFWNPGEAGAHAQLKEFIKKWAGQYDRGRDIPSEAGTSRLSPHLHFGEISPRRVWHEIKRFAGQNARKPPERKAAEIYLKEIVWREFAHHLLYHFPHTPFEPLKKQFEKFPWRKDAKRLKAWQKGMTGYPVVDAGMRELWHTGWMHNRVRMITASFLIKDLLIPWQEGAKWFWDTLVDADLASNTLGWQWTAGCGADASPFFRIFNPMTQGEKFDPHGQYVRKWIPEIAKLPDEWIHKPFEAPAEVLKQAGIILSKTYPEPLVNHADARKEALNLLQKIRG